MSKSKPVVGVIMGSKSDWEVMKHCSDTLKKLEIPCEARAISAHRTPALLEEYMRTAPSRGIKVVIAAAGGAAHLAGVAAALSPLPVLAVPMESQSLKGLDSLLAMVQMPAGIPVGTLAIGKPGAINAALFAAAILALSDAAVAKALEKFRADQTAVGVANSILDG
ncbi:MAG: 5-(carboxyamino)imidazole ribonucleotide mutase [Pseudomonadota bacterium]